MGRDDKCADKAGDMARPRSPTGDIDAKGDSCRTKEMWQTEDDEPEVSLF